MSHDTLPSQFATELARAVEAANLALTPEQIEAATSYAEELLRWNPRAGLTTVEDPSSIARRHFLESFLLAAMLPPGPLSGLDIGSGGGFPGLALKIVRPDVAMTLLEPRQAKAAFLRHVARSLVGAPTAVLTRRLEELPAGSTWDFASFRGVRFAPSAVLRVIKPGGLLLGYSGEGLDALAAGLSRAGASRIASQQIPGRQGSIEAWRLPS